MSEKIQPISDLDKHDVIIQTGDSKVPIDTLIRKTYHGCYKVEGYLKKRATKLGWTWIWRRYWFVLDGKILLYYKSHSSYKNLGTCKGLIDFGLVHSVRAIESASNTKSSLCVIEVVTRTGTTYLGASCLETCRIWTTALQNIVGLMEVSWPYKIQKPPRASAFGFPPEQLLRDDDSMKKGNLTPTKANSIDSPTPSELSKSSSSEKCSGDKSKSTELLSDTPSPIEYTELNFRDKTSPKNSVKPIKRSFSLNIRDSSQRFRAMCRQQACCFTTHTTDEATLSSRRSNRHGCHRNTSIVSNHTYCEVTESDTEHSDRTKLIISPQPPAKAPSLSHLHVNPNDAEEFPLFLRSLSYHGSPSKERFSPEFTVEDHEDGSTPSIHVHFDNPIATNSNAAKKPHPDSPYSSRSSSSSIDKVTIPAPITPETARRQAQLHSTPSSDPASGSPPKSAATPNISRFGHYRRGFRECANQTQSKIPIMKPTTGQSQNATNNEPHSTVPDKADLPPNNLIEQNVLSKKQHKPRSESVESDEANSGHKKNDIDSRTFSKNKGAKTAAKLVSKKNSPSNSQNVTFSKSTGNKLLSSNTSCCSNVSRCSSSSRTFSKATGKKMIATETFSKASGKATGKNLTALNNQIYQNNLHNQLEQLRMSFVHETNPEDREEIYAQLGLEVQEQYLTFGEETEDVVDASMVSVYDNNKRRAVSELRELLEMLNDEGELNRDKFSEERIRSFLRELRNWKLRDDQELYAEQERLEQLDAAHNDHTVDNDEDDEEIQTTDL